MNRNICQLAGAVGPAITGGLARSPGPYPGDQALRKLLTDVVFELNRHTPASMPTQFGLPTIPPRPFRAYNPVTRVTS